MPEILNRPSQRPGEDASEVLPPYEAARMERLRYTLTCLKWSHAAERGGRERGQEQGRVGGWEGTSLL